MIDSVLKCIIFSTVLLIIFISSVSGLAEGEVCRLRDNRRGLCTSHHLCRTAHDVEQLGHSLQKCNPQDRHSQLVCCSENGRTERIYEPRRTSNKFRNEFRSSTGRPASEETFDNIETIFDVKRALQDPTFADSARKKHSVFSSSSHRHETETKPQYSSSLYEPNHVQPSFTSQRKPSTIRPPDQSYERTSTEYNVRSQYPSRVNIAQDEEQDTLKYRPQPTIYQPSSHVQQGFEHSANNRHEEKPYEVHTKPNKNYYDPGQRPSRPISSSPEKQTSSWDKAPTIYQPSNQKPQSGFEHSSPNRPQDKPAETKPNKHYYDPEQRPLRPYSPEKPFETQTKPNNNHYEHEERPTRPSSPVKPSETHTKPSKIYYEPEQRPLRPSSPEKQTSPWQEPPRPLVEESHGYPDYSATTTRRSLTTQRLRPVPKRISEQKCKEYSQIVTETIAGLPLTTDPKPVEINIQKCNYNAQQLIVGGQNTSVGEFPHMAAVGFLDRKRRTIAWSCGGSLISEHFVLTAAHCTTSTYGAPSVVRLGEHNLKRGDDGAHPVDYLVKEVVRHPNYRPPVRYHDIALLRLSRPVAFDTHIRPACLYVKPTFSTSKTVATGWGRIEYAEEQSDILLKVVLSIIDNERCNNLYKTESRTEVLSLGIIEEQMCAGELNGGKDTCQGDSGGPIEITSRANQCIHHVIGVTSFGKRCGQPNAPGVYTRVSSYLSWIEGVVWPELVRAQANIP